MWSHLFVVEGFAKQGRLPERIWPSAAEPRLWEQVVASSILAVPTNLPGERDWRGCGAATG